MAIAVTSVASCNKDDHDNEEATTGAQYVFLEPCLDWTFGKDQVKDFMKSFGKDWNLVTEGYNEDEDDIEYENEKTVTQIIYSFESGKLNSVEIFYGTNKKFDKMKSDWAAKYDLSWTDKEFSGVKYSEAENKAKHCGMIAQKGSASVIDYMMLTFNHEPWL